MSEMSVIVLPERLLPAGRNSITVEQLEARREMAVSLRGAGLSMQSTLRELNKLSKQKNLGSISLRTLERDIAAYYRENKALISDDDNDHIEMLRNSHMAQLENTIEEMSLMIASKSKANNWRPFEKATALEKLFKMQKEMAGLQNPSIGIRSTTISINNQIKTETPKPEVSKYPTIQEWEAFSDYIYSNPDFSNEVLAILQEAIESDKQGENPDLVHSRLILQSKVIIQKYSGNNDERMVKRMVEELF